MVGNTQDSSSRRTDCKFGTYGLLAMELRQISPPPPVSQTSSPLGIYLLCSSSGQLCGSQELISVCFNYLLLHEKPLQNLKQPSSAGQFFSSMQCQIRLCMWLYPVGSSARVRMSMMTPFVCLVLNQNFQSNLRRCLGLSPSPCGSPAGQPHIFRPKMMETEAAKSLKAQTQNWQRHLYHILLAKANDVASQIQKEENKRLPLGGRNSMLTKRWEDLLAAFFVWQSTIVVLVGGQQSSTAPCQEVGLDKRVL